MASGAAQVNRNIDGWVRRIEAAVLGLADNVGMQMERHAKLNAPWTDRTGMARKYLHYSIRRKSGFLVLRIGHGMSYGIFLELAHGQKYKIIKPTRDEYAPVFFGAVKRLLGR